MDGYKLRQVHIFTRHGDRSPGKTIPGHMPPNLNCNFSNWYKGADDKIQAFAPKMDSMSDPVPFHQKRLYPNRASCQPRSLTARGALQHIKLGQFLQNVYMNKQGLIDKVNPYGPQLLLKSTIHSRTFESAMAFLYGFIPQFDVSKLAFEVVKHTGFCSEKSPNITSCLCQRYLDTDKRIRHRKSHSNKWETYILQRVISGIFEQPSKDIPIMTSVGDALTPGFCHSSAPPCGPLGSQNYKSQNETSCVTLDLMGKIWKEITKELKAHSDDEYLLAAALKLYPVLFEIASRMDDLRSFRFAPRFVLYSGHDITVTPLLLILGLHDGKWPPYASRLVIETVESLKTKDYHVRFIYNGVDRTSDTVFCKSSALNDGLCPLDLFLKFVFTDVLQNFGYASYSTRKLAEAEMVVSNMI